MKLENLSATELGTLVNTKKISPVEVIDYFEKRIKLRNPSINAFTYTRFDEARKVAKEQERKIMKGANLGHFAGVPVALKDFLPSKKGWPASHGGVRCLHTIDDEDSMFTKSVESQGAIVVGKTNAPSFGFRALTDNYEFGATSTPFKIGYNSGGSSGGSCAAVADGLVGLAETGDAGGSTRCPSAWCHVFGYKASAGLIPSVCRPDAWTATHPYCCSGAAGRTVEDVAIAIEGMMKYNSRDPLSIPLYSRDSLVRTLHDSITGMRIGVTYDFGVFPDPESEIAQAVNECAEVLRESGAIVKHVDFNLDWSLYEVEQAWLIGICLDTAIDMELWKKNGFDLDKDHHEDLPEDFFKYNKIAINSNAMDYRKFHEIRTALLDSHLDVFEDVDVVIAPVTGCLPVPNAKNGDTRGPQYIKGQKVDDLIGFAYTYLENMTGFPAASVPFKLSNEGLPIGIQVIAKRYCDYQVFRVASKLEEMHPWRNDYEIAYNRM